MVVGWMGFWERQKRRRIYEHIDNCSTINKAAYYVIDLLTFEIETLSAI